MQTGFELIDMTADGRLRQRKLARGSGKTAFAHHRQKGAERLPIGLGHTFSYSTGSASRARIVAHPNSPRRKSNGEKDESGKRRHDAHPWCDAGRIASTEHVGNGEIDHA